jgi:hypothetical protein
VTVVIPNATQNNTSKGRRSGDEFRFNVLLSNRVTEP